MKTTTENKKSAPTHIAYHVSDSANGKGFWTRVGAAWAHQDGNGFSLQMKLMPQDGRITIRVANDNPRENEGQ